MYGTLAGALSGRKIRYDRQTRVHPQGCPAHASVKDAITVTWDATVHAGDEVITLSSSDETAETE